jgi:1-acyl-sn-glycerol-3-phosphate acyltransferase
VPDARVVPLDGAKSSRKSDRSEPARPNPTRTNATRANTAQTNTARTSSAQSTAKAVPAKPAAAKPTGSRAFGDRIRNRAQGAGRRTSRPVIPPPEELRDLDDFFTDVGSPVSGPGYRAGAPADTDADTDTPTGGAEDAERGEHEPGTGDVWERRLNSALGFLRRRLTGEYEVDDFGFDRELLETVLAAPFRPLYEKYFRVEALGLENVPREGGALVVANHSGVIAIDAAMTQLALLDHHPAGRNLRMLGADLVFSAPFLSSLARKAGATLACNPDAERLLSAGELVGVWPEGFKGIGKPFSERYKLQRFGRGGFVSAALRTGVPIIPCSIVGAEEIYPMLGNSRFLARLLGAPYFPLTPTFPWLGPLGLIPLPSKWYI